MDGWCRRYAAWRSAIRKNTGTKLVTAINSKFTLYMCRLFDRIHFFLETWFQSEPSPDREVGIVARLNFTPERYETCPVLFFRPRFARTFSRCNRLLICSQ